MIITLFVSAAVAAGTAATGLPTPTNLPTPTVPVIRAVAAGSPWAPTASPVGAQRGGSAQSARGAQRGWPRPRPSASLARLLLAARCPVRRPATFFDDPGTIRRLPALCVQSVREARSDRAARAVVYAFTAIGSRYSQSARGLPGIYDCSSLVSRAWFAAGAVAMRQGGAASPYWPTTYTLLAGVGGTRAVAGPGLPGDLVFPHTGHVMMRIARGLVIHAANPSAGVRLGSGQAWVVMRVS
ncbi:MAG: peptidoglycan DL-endopeptidase CwlO [Actinomycetota bacterium]|nr:peptidoglycan DL-endopeptidase CwlO [Actinomycetota bacterium]